MILTMSWNYYIQTSQEKTTIDFIEKCSTLDKNVVAFNGGDFGVKVPYIKNLIILRSSGYRSKFTKNEHAMPSFITDPLKKYYQTDRVFERPYISKPVIGFCGQANDFFLMQLKKSLERFYEIRKVSLV